MPCRDIAPRRKGRRPAPSEEPGRGVRWVAERTSVRRRRMADERAGRKRVVVRRSCASGLWRRVASGQRVPRAVRMSCESSSRKSAARSPYIIATADRQKGHATPAVWRGVERPFVGSRRAAMIRAATMSSTVRSGISEFANGSRTSKPSPCRRGIRWMWK